MSSDSNPNDIFFFLLLFRIVRGQEGIDDGPRPRMVRGNVNVMLQNGEGKENIDRSSND